jgi:hypothetical protein
MLTGLIIYISGPTKWEELPLPALHIRNAVRHLARFLARAHDIDEEVVDFTENGGWQKIESVLPLMFNCHLRLKSWIQCLRHFTSALKVSIFFLRRGNL